MFVNVNIYNNNSININFSHTKNNLASYFVAALALTFESD